MASPMDLCDVEDIRAVIDAVTDKALFEEFIHWDKLERDYDPSVTDASMVSESASDSPSDRTWPTTMEKSDVTSNAFSYDHDQDDMMQDTETSSRLYPCAKDRQSGLDSTGLLIPVLRDEHKEPTVVSRPLNLPPSGGLVAPGVHLRSSRLLAPAPSAHPSAITSWSHGSPPRPEVSQGRSQRPRKVFDPKKTAGVRAKGSCQHCSILKVACDLSNLCGRCGRWDPSNHKRICVRSSLGTILQSGQRSILDPGRWTPERTQLASSPYEPSRLGEPTLITVYFSASDRQGLSVPVVKYRDGNFRIAHGCSVVEAEIVKWAESDLGRASPSDFQRSVESFLYLYSQRNFVEKKPLVDSVLRMSSMWRLISASDLRCDIGPIGQQYKKCLPSSIADQLKRIAQQKLSSVEKIVMEEIDKLIPNAFSNYESDAPAVWASLWAVILLYRQALQMVASHAAAFRDNFGEVTRRLLDTLIVALCGHYRTHKALKALDDATLPPLPDNATRRSFLNDDEVRVAYGRARLKRFCFYEEVQAAKCHGDDLIEAHVVNNEHKVMGRRRQRGGRQNVTVELDC